MQGEFNTWRDLGVGVHLHRAFKDTAKIWDVKIFCKGNLMTWDGRGTWGTFANGISRLGGADLGLGGDLQRELNDLLRIWDA